jgi:hypothetical protein
MSKESREKQRILRERYDERRRWREAEEAVQRPFKDRVKAIFDAPRFTVMDFWCNTCKKDCTGTGYRQVGTLRDRLPTAWFIGYCPRGHKMIRRITDKSSDPYYDSSFIIMRQRYELADALLTPDDPRFKLLYPKQYAELTRDSQ